MKQVLNCRSGSERIGEKGVAAVEFALMLPFLILFMVVVIDLGLLLREHQILSNAAREGARASSLPKNWVSPQNPTATVAAIKNRVIEYCNQEGLTVAAGQVTVNQDFDIDVAGKTLKASEVTVTVDHPLMFLGSFLGSSSVPLQGTSIFANQY